jgi:hypothetical protein
VTIGGFFCATVRHLSWTNATCGGSDSDNFWPLSSLGSSQRPESLIINAEAA